jgi:2-polyprenyl-3-methyl-5-hydroxy-6-metoxy-1,4-benzoquinol methylase
MSSSYHPSFDEQKQFWDWHWQHWQDRKTINEWKDKRHSAVVALLESLSLTRPRILDVGCGPGWYTDKFADFGDVTGVDISEDAIKMAKSRFPHIKFLAGNFYELSLPANSFDVVITQEVIDHVDDAAVFIERVAKVLKPGGHLIVACANKFVVDRLRKGNFPKQPRQHIARHFEMKTLTSLLDRHFRMIELKTIIPMGELGILRIINSYKLNRLVGALISDERLTSIKENAGFGYQIIALAQKKHA